MIGLACAAVLATTSCSDSAPNPDPAEPRTGGPIVLGGAPATTCIAPPEGVADFTYGVEGIAPEGVVDLHIKDVTIANPDNVQVTEAFLLTGNQPLIGNHSSWPPPPHLIASDFKTGWAERQPARGAVVTQSQEGSLTGLVLHLRRPNPQEDAGFDHVEVMYEADGVDYVADSTVAFEAKSDC